MGWSEVRRVPLRCNIGRGGAFGLIHDEAYYSIRRYPLKLALVALLTLLFSITTYAISTSHCFDMGLFQSATLALFGASAAALAAPQSPSWHKYVRSPSSTNVKPVTIIASETKGDVKNADGFLSGKSTTVLSRSQDSDTPPSIVVDFGQNVVGLLGISFAGSTNGTSNSLPGLKLAFSESMQFLTNSSDFTRSFNAGGVSIPMILSRSFLQHADLLSRTKSTPTAPTSSP